MFAAALFVLKAQRVKRFFYTKSLSKQANSNNLKIDPRFDGFEYF
jgi:hypothetical protein